MAWNLDSDRPIFLQIIERLQTDIISGRYSPGDKLPSVRELAAEAAVNPNTMQKAFGELERSGLVYSQRTSGRFITEDLDMIKALKQRIAREKIEAFLSGMKKIGFQDEEILSLMKQSLNQKSGGSKEHSYKAQPE